MAVKVVDIRDEIDYTDEDRKRHRKLALEEAMQNLGRFVMEHQLEVASAAEGAKVGVEIPLKQEYRFTYSFGQFGEQGQGVAQSSIPQESEGQDQSSQGSQEGSPQNEDGQGRGRQEQEEEGSDENAQDGGQGAQEDQEEQDGADEGAGEGEKERRVRRGMEVGRLNENEQPQGQAEFGFGEGSGEEGEDEAQGDESQEGGEKAGHDPGQDKFDTDFPIDDLRDKLTEEFELPELDPRSISVLKTKKISRPHGTRSKGPWSKIHRDKTIQEHDRRISAEFNGDSDGEEYWRPEDFRFRRSELDEQYLSNLVICLDRDSSGSMNEEKLKRILALALHWVRAGRKTHTQVAIEFISFDTEAKHRSEAEFLYRNSSGGTKISSGSDMILHLEREKYRREDWNWMIIFFTDGENASEDMSQMKESFAKCCEFAKFFAYYEVMASGNVISSKEIRELAEMFDNFVPFSIKEVKDVPEAFTAVVEAIKKANRKKEAIYG